MSLNNKGSILYETLIAFTLLVFVLTHFISYIRSIEQERINAHYVYQKKQTLVANLLLLEGKQPLMESEEYRLVVEDGLICILFTDLNNQAREVCLAYEQ